MSILNQYWASKQRTILGIKRDWPFFWWPLQMTYCKSHISKINQAQLQTFKKKPIVPFHTLVR